MRIKTAELTGVALDWVVAKCEGVSQQQWAWYRRTCAEEEVPENRPHCYAFSTQWSAGGPVIERERIELSTTNASPEAWRANGFDYMERCSAGVYSTHRSYALFRGVEVR